VAELTVKSPVPFRLHLHVEAGSARDFELWNWSLSPMFAMDTPDRRLRRSFAFDATAYYFADMSVGSSTSSPSLFDRTPQVIARSGIDHLLVQAYLGGGYRLEADGREIEVKTGDVCVIDFARTSRLQTTPFSQLSVVLPRSVMELLIPDVDILHGLVLPRGSPLNTILVSHLRTLFAQCPGLSLEEGRAAARGTAALIAAFVGPSTDGHDAAAEALALASLRTLRRVVEANLDNPELGPNFLMRHVGISRATLYRLFEPLGGVRSYIQQRRLTRAFLTICDTAFHKERIGVIARRCGFTGDAVFSRAFRMPMACRRARCVRPRSWAIWTPWIQSAGPAARSGS